jgi:hypothetical protein
MEKRRHPKNGGGRFRHPPRLAAPMDNAGLEWTTSNFMNFLEILNLAFE